MCTTLLAHYTPQHWIAGNSLEVVLLLDTHSHTNSRSSAPPPQAAVICGDLLEIVLLPDTRFLSRTQTYTEYCDVILFCSASPHIGPRGAGKAGGVVHKEGRGGWEGGVTGGGWGREQGCQITKQALALFGLRLEVFAEVRRTVSRGGAHPKKEVERRQKVSSGEKYKPI
ncbi:hypothetical protein DFH08DRAFT_817246 [Mycena albidolilacea]|uniref:Uncharacterized protein n=1 Tax=Mycena albidolilacea TaxID=1033008 RepID=A0AAD6ZJ77_9AGAR|nr:hypothetical protein DFH08DRAFT_817246 [Mycena albidolilacea]